MWFHHVAWDYRLANGRTLWQSLCDHYNAGVRRVAAYRVLWQSPAVRSYVDKAQWLQVDNLGVTDISETDYDRCLDYLLPIYK